MVSRRHGIWIPLALLMAGCASSGITEVQRLQAQAAWERGLRSMAENDPAAALQALKEAVALNAREPRYQDTLGLLYLQLRRPDLAAEHFRKALESDPKYADAHFHLGAALAEQQQWEEAVGAYRRAIALPTLTVPDFAHQNLGLALYHLKRYAEAEQSLRFAISLDPGLQAAYYNLGLVFLAEDRKEDARAAFRQARQLGPDSPFGRAAQDRLRTLGEGG